MIGTPVMAEPEVRSNERFMVDSCVWIDHFKQNPTREVQRLGLALLDGASVWTCGPILQEVLAGVMQPKQAERLRSQFEALDYAQIDDEADFLAAADIYRRCRQQGATPRSSYDCLIAQLCIAHDVPLLTSDRDFSAIARAVPLRLA
jgi:predicted nucleic acid-binding protein